MVEDIKRLNSGAHRVVNFMWGSDGGRDAEAQFCHQSESFCIQAVRPVPLIRVPYVRILIPQADSVFDHFRAPIFASHLTRYQCP